MTPGLCDAALGYYWPDNSSKGPFASGPVTEIMESKTGVRERLLYYYFIFRLSHGQTKSHTS